MNKQILHESTLPWPLHIRDTYSGESSSSILRHWGTSGATAQSPPYAPMTEIKQVTAELFLFQGGGWESVWSICERERGGQARVWASCHQWTGCSSCSTQVSTTLFEATVHDSTFDTWHQQSNWICSYLDCDLLVWTCV